MTQAQVAGAPAAERAVAKLTELSADLRAAAVLAPDGSVIASTGEAAWSERATELWEAADASGAGGAVTQLHVAGESGEVFAVRDGGITAIAVTDRFALESLMFCDLRAVLRELGDEV